MPDVYREPAYGEAKGSFAHYAALVGEDTCFPSKRPTRPDDIGGRGIDQITDGTSNCIMVAPVEPGRKVPWTKPEDFVVGPDFPGLGKPGGIATAYTLGGTPGAIGVAPILYADGSVHLVAATIHRSTLNALLSVNNGEAIKKGDVPEDFFALHPASKVLKIRVAGNMVTTTIEDAPAAPEAAPVGEAQKPVFEKRTVPGRSARSPSESPERRTWRRRQGPPIDPATPSHTHENDILISVPRKKRTGADFRPLNLPEPAPCLPTYPAFP